MTEQTPDAQASYIVSINNDGSLTTQAVTVGVARKATTYDIFQSSKQLASEIEELLLADRIAARIIASLNPPSTEEQQKARLKDALSERGIDPSKE